MSKRPKIFRQLLAQRLEGVKAEAPREAASLKDGDSQVRDEGTAGSPEQRLCPTELKAIRRRESKQLRVQVWITRQPARVGTGRCRS